MCLIFVRDNVINANTGLPVENLKRAFIRNPDGCGFLWLKDGKWFQCRSTEYTEEQVIEFATELDGYADRWAVHFRFATHGTVAERNCHPFKIGENAYLMHNGILPYEPTRKERSDTWQFAQYLRQIGVDKIPKILPLLEQSTEGSRMLYCMPDGSMLQTGTWSAKLEGDYSNTQCFPYVATGYKYVNAAGATVYRYPQSHFADTLDDAFGNIPICDDDYTPPKSSGAHIYDMRIALRDDFGIPNHEVWKMGPAEVVKMYNDLIGETDTVTEPTADDTSGDTVAGSEFKNVTDCQDFLMREELIEKGYCLPHEAAAMTHDELLLNYETVFPESVDNVVS